jgi:tRNA(Ile)-lysidine synthase
MEKLFREKVQSTVVRYHLLQPHDRVVVAVSGGPDSIALLFSLFLLRDSFSLKLFFIHINHLIRGEEARKDADFTAGFARKLGIPGRILNSDVALLAREKKLSLEQAGRYARYALLRRHAHQLCATRVATGHNIDDQAETILMNLLRGAGSRGLRGIHPCVGGLIIRPLLEVSRDEIMAFLSHHKLEYRTDTSNFLDRHLRNRIRNNLMPMLVREYNPHMRETLWTTCQMLKDDDDILQKISGRLFKRLSDCGRDSVMLDISSISSLPMALQRRVLRIAVESLKGNLDDISFNHIERLRESMTKRVGSTVNLPGAMSGERKYQHLVIFKTPCAEECAEVKEAELEIPGMVNPEGLNIRIRTEICSYHPSSFTTTGREAFFDMDRAIMPLRIRKRKHGDRFVPLGMGGSKKLKEFLIELKIDRKRRDSIPLLVDKEDRIMWVVGYRIDDRFKVTPSSQRILLVKAEDA